MAYYITSNQTYTIHQGIAVLKSQISSQIYRTTHAHLQYDPYEEHNFLIWLILAHSDSFVVPKETTKVYPSFQRI